MGAEAATSALLTRAQLQLQAEDPAAAVATLKALDGKDVDQPAAIATLARAYRALNDREQLFALLPRLPRAALKPAEREKLEKLAVEGELARADLTAERLAQVWATLPSELRGAPAMVAEHARALMRLGDGEQAERELRGALKRDWHSALVAAYGEIRGADAAKQLKQAETWLEAHADDAALLMTVARLSLQNELWGKARSFLEASLALAPKPAAYALYGRLLLQLGEDAEALAAFRSGLALVSAPADEPLPPARGATLPPRVDRKVGN
jgi:HemY protein